MSVNAITITQISVACRHFRELRDAGVTENLGIRILEHLVDVYAKLLTGGSATPHHVRQVSSTQWSIAALALRSKDPNAPLRVEHGTPKRALARIIFQMWEQDRLTQAQLETLIYQRWKLAVITLEEDKRLNRLARSQMFATPDERWASAGISFPTAAPLTSLAAADPSRSNPTDTIPRPLSSEPNRPQEP